MADFPPPALDGPPPTRRLLRQEQPAPTRLTGFTPGRERAAPGPSDWVPPGRGLTFVRPIASGGEADVVLVRDRKGRELALKVYQPGVVPDERVRQLLPGLTGPHIVRTIEAGSDGRRHYELMDYLPEGDLSDLPVPLGVEDITRLVRQLIEALSELHDHGVTHRDLKPANVRLGGRNPLRAVLIDFGLSTRLDQVMAFGGRSRTPRYAAPEQIAGTITPANDYWSLGMIVAELAGRHPFQDIHDEQAITEQITCARPILLPDDLDPALRTLCRGLLVRDWRDRWGLEEVRMWLAGEPPEVPGEAPEREALVFEGLPFTDRAGLAVSLAANWGTACATFAPSAPSWPELRSWLAQFGDEEGLGRTVERVERGDLPPDGCLFMLLRWMNPLLAVYLGNRLDRASVPMVARRAFEEGEGTALDMVTDLWEFHLLTMIDSAPGCAGSSAVDRLWRAYTERWPEVTARLAARHPEAGGTLAMLQGPRLSAYLLWLASAPGADGEVLSWVSAAQRRVRRTAETAGERLDWFDEAVSEATDPVGRLAVFTLSRLAQAEADRLRRRHHVATRRRDRRLHEWNRRERWRDLDRPIALGWAAASMAVFIVGWALLLLLSDAVPLAATETVTRSWIFLVISATLLTGTELWLAAMIGAPYHPRYSLLLGAGRVADVLARRDGPPWMSGLVIVLGTLAALAVMAVFAPYLLPLILVPGHIAWVHRRYRRWSADHAARRRRALGEETT